MDQYNKNDIVTELIKLIKKSSAHVSFEEALADLPAKSRTEIPGDLPYSIWQLVEHMRITQKDILVFSLSENYKPMKWPDNYWTENKESVSDADWNNSIKEIKKDRHSFFELLKNNQNDLFQPFEWGEGQNLFREAVLIADHNSYHTAEIVVIRRLLKCWN